MKVLFESFKTVKILLDYFEILYDKLSFKCGSDQRTEQVDEGKTLKKYFFSKPNQLFPCYFWKELFLQQIEQKPWDVF